VAYLLETLDPETRVWRAVPLDTNDHPHAPWWHDEDGSLARTFDGFEIVPRVEIVALLYPYASLLPARWLETMTRGAVAAVEAAASLGAGGGSDLTYAARLAGAEGLAPGLRRRLVEQVRAAAPRAVCRDPEGWSSYCLTPLEAAPTPDALLADRIADALQAHLDYTIAGQDAEGTWGPTWSWGGTYPEVWPQAEREWRGEITLRRLLSLRAFGRIAG
jgi:hypothetical protein